MVESKVDPQSSSSILYACLRQVPELALPLDRFCKDSEDEMEELLKIVKVCDYALSFINATKLMLL